jgi:hypothetical protein
MRLLILLACTLPAFGQTLLQQNYDARAFAWSRTNGLGASGDLSSPGAGKTITVSPPPKGVYGSSSDHYVYISDGTGTAEAALITGGTCTATSVGMCSIVVTTANAHTGAWKVGTATAGIQEAINSMGASGGEVYIPAGDHYTYAPVYVSRGYVSIRGAGMHSTLIHNQTTDSSNVVTFTSGSLGQFNSISDIGFFCPQSAGTAAKAGGAVVSLTNQAYFYASRLYIAYPPTGINSINSGWVLDEVNMREVKPTTGLGLLVDGGGAFDNYVRHMTIDAGAAYFAGIRIVSSGYIAIDRCDIIHAIYDLLIDPGNGQAVFNVDAIGNYFDTAYGSGVRIAPTGTGKVWRSHFTGNWTSSGVNTGFVAVAAGSAEINGLKIIGHHSQFNGEGGYIIDGNVTNFELLNSIAAGNSLSSAGGFPGVTIGGGTSGGTISNNRLGPWADSSDSQSYGLVLYSGAGDNLIVTGNDLRGNTTGPMLDLATGVNKIIKDNLGVDNATPSTVASAASIAMPTQSVAYVSGTTQITTITGGWKGREITLIFTNASPGGVGTGGNIARAQTAAQNQAIRLTFDGTNWY